MGDVEDRGEVRVVGPGFRDKVYAVVRKIPPGRVATYGDVATMLGSPRVARQVGFALAGLPAEKEPEIPWHRVINAQGRISSRGDDLRAMEQEHRLTAEGVAFDENGKCDLPKYRWRPNP